MKIAYQRGRPSLWPALVLETTYSFPSGHATMATLFFGCLAVLVFHLARRQGARAVAPAIAFVLAAAVSLSRVYLGAHWTTDALAGMLVGLFWVVLFAIGMSALERRARRARAGGAPPALSE